VLYSAKNCAFCHVNGTVSLPALLAFHRISEEHGYEEFFILHKGGGKFCGCSWRYIATVKKTLVAGGLEIGNVDSDVTQPAEEEEEAVYVRLRVYLENHQPQE
jgi:hypothetical protein